MRNPLTAFAQGVRGHSRYKWRIRLLLQRRLIFNICSRRNLLGITYSVVSEDSSDWISQGVIEMPLLMPLLHLTLDHPMWTNSSYACILCDGWKVTLGAILIVVDFTFDMPKRQISTKRNISLGHRQYKFIQLHFTGCDDWKVTLGWSIWIWTFISNTPQSRISTQRNFSLGHQQHG